jgi:3-oxoacyl-[acyl-carrier protein] reductase
MLLMRRSIKVSAIIFFNHSENIAYLRETWRTVLGLHEFTVVNPDNHVECFNEKKAGKSTLPSNNLLSVLTKSQLTYKEKQMDLRIKNKVALVCASSQGLGLACATALAREGADVFINGRDQERLDKARAAIKAETGVTVQTVLADITTETGRQTLFDTCPTLSILVNNNAGPMPGKLADWDHDTWIRALESNMLAPILIIRGFLPGMRERRFGRIVNITSAMVKSPRPHQALSTSARTGLTAFSKSMSLDVAVDNVTINNLLPERIDTPRQEFLVDRLMKTEQLTREQARGKFAETIAAKRFGTPEEFADACAFLCSAQAGFISGQNLQLDGGSYPGLM